MSQKKGNTMPQLFHFHDEKEKRERRSDVYLWDNLEHLKDAYAGYINPSQIDEIASQIRREGKFKKRTGLSNQENESCFYNLVDSLIMEKLNKKFPTMKKQPDNIVQMEDI